jgi:hypothetical protein
MLVIFLVQFIYFVVLVLKGNAMGALARFFQITPITALLGIIIGISGIRDKGHTNKTLPKVTLSVGLIFVFFYLYMLYSWSFGG